MLNNMLSPEEQASVDAWNEHGIEVTDLTMKKSLPAWFGNIRSLIQANIPMQSIEDLATQYADRKHIVVLGSGPSIPTIVANLPRDDKSRMLICGPTAVASLLVAKLQPDIIMVADSSPAQYANIRDLQIDNIAEYKIALPVTADKSWYDSDSIFKPSQLYFYLPYLDYEGSADLAYNDILHILFPDVHRWIKQAGSVGNAMVMFADMICLDDASKRIYLGIDCCGWLSSLPQLRTSYATKQADGSYTPVFTDSQRVQNAEDTEYAMRITANPCDLQVNLVSLGYAIQMLYFIHFSENSNPTHSERFVMLIEASRLPIAVKDVDVDLPLLHAYEVGMDVVLPKTENWAYRIMLKLIELSNKHKKYLIAKEAEDVKESHKD